MASSRVRGCVGEVRSAGYYARQGVGVVDTVSLHSHHCSTITGREVDSTKKSADLSNSSKSDNSRAKVVLQEAVDSSNSRKFDNSCAKVVLQEAVDSSNSSKSDNSHAKVVLQEAVDSVISSFAKHAQINGRGDCFGL